VPSLGECGTFLSDTRTRPVQKLLPSNWPALFVEQYLLWTFACCWLLAALYQGAIFAPAAEPTEVALAESAA